MLARFHGGLPPFTVTSKIILVESGEVVFYNVVTSRVERRFDEFASRYGRSPMQPVIRAALDRGVAHTTADLWNAFREACPRRTGIGKEERCRVTGIRNSSWE